MKNNFTYTIKQEKPIPSNQRERKKRINEVINIMRIIYNIATHEKK